MCDYIWIVPVALTLNWNEPWNKKKNVYGNEVLYMRAAATWDKVARGYSLQMMASEKDRQSESGATAGGNVSTEQFHFMQMSSGAP